MDGTTSLLEPSPSLTWLTVDAPYLAPEALFDHLATRSPEADDSDVLFWDDGSTTWVGSGAAAVASAHGADRWDRARDRAEAVFRRFDVGGDGSRDGGPRLFGGLAFRAGGARSPAWRSFGDARFVLPHWLYRLDADGASVGVAVPARTVATGADRSALEARLRRALDRLARELPEDQATGSGPAVGLETPDPADWRATVDSALSELAAGRVRKVVAARPFDARFRRPPRAGAVLRALARAGEGGPAVRFAFHRGSSARTATFLGRTPERLVAVDEDRVRSEALAGTAPVGCGAGSTLLASAKDLLEHRLVVEAIADRLRPLCRRLLYDTRPRLRSSAGVQHLLTPIEGEPDSPVHLLDAARLLHPTPAVCGLPTAAAARWIAGHEHQERGWYSGAIGHFDAAGRGEMRVALRCALLTADGGSHEEGVHRARAWAGAGLVPGSDADRELEEINLKASTMLGAFEEAAAEAEPRPTAVHVPFTRPA